MPSRMTRLAPVLLGVLAFGLASCGGDDAPSQEDYADRANQVCREAEQSLENLGEGAESPEEVVRVVDRVIEAFRNAVDELEDLERPEGEAGETAEEFVEANRTEIEEQGIPALEDLREALENGDQQAAQDALRRLQEVDTSDSNRAARELGAAACGEG
jgi:translation initiation factor 2B subunit (eIF-2B alpha/beta/delta family)